MDVAGSLREWFAVSARALPWRSRTRTPYEVLVSELMLQQTQVERVVPSYVAFMERFPTIGALAAAAEEEVVAAWSGLGYYRRARLLHALARRLVAAGSDIPGTAEELESLPGVGPYTAAAVAAIAFGEPAPAVDGNVARVACRFLGLAGDPRRAAARRRIVGWVRSLVQEGPPDVVTEALMELGATVCRPAAAWCERCPLASGCRAHGSGDPLSCPPPRSRRAAVDLRWVAACCIDPGGKWLLRRVEEGPILVGLWLPPLAEIGPRDDPVACTTALRLPRPIAVPRPLPEVRHSITHRRIRVLPVVLACTGGEPSRGDGAERWLDPHRSTVPTSSLLAKLVSAVTGPRSTTD